MTQGVMIMARLTNDEIKFRCERATDLVALMVISFVDMKIERDVL